MEALEELIMTQSKSITKLQLQQQPINFVYKALGASFWSLRQLQKSKAPRSILEKVIREGGAGDTNGAIVGALMGSYLGFNKIYN